MQRKLIVTSDGSHSVSVEDMNVTYHSVLGAIQESIHVFIKAGLIKVLEQPSVQDNLKILDVGFGTGLNALLTLIAIEDIDVFVDYEAIEPFPLDKDIVEKLNYCEILERPDLQPKFETMHHSTGDEEITIAQNLVFRKSNAELRNFRTGSLKNLIYFDPFDPKVQPELWTDEIFKKLVSILRPGGILVTYSSKGSVRRAMQAAGFSVEKIPGPLGKREIVRAIKI
jgi:tRNA U34 5-methylaminomethyl-2-thiouridine-forming methyltransferase MnmC